MAVESTWVPGSPVTYRVGGTRQIEGRVLDVERPTLLITSFTLLYYPEEERDAQSRMSWEITPMGEVCKLTAMWSGQQAEGPTARDVTICTPSIMANLKVLLETGRPRLIKEIVFDCADPARLSAFWAAATRYVMQGPPPTGLRGRPHRHRGPAWRGPGAGVPARAGDESWEEPSPLRPPRGRSRGRDRAAASTGCAPGAGLSRPGVLLDPEGNEFCVVG